MATTSDSAWNSSSASAEQKAVFFRDTLLHVHIGLNPHPGCAALRFQHGDDLLRRAVTEELSQSFLVIGNAVLLHQGDEIGRRVTRQR